MSAANTLTETQARLKWCPMGRIALTVSNAGAVTVNDPSSDVPAAHSVGCVASDCMMWRDRTVDSHDVRGYCGLAPLPLTTVTIGDRSVTQP